MRLHKIAAPLLIVALAASLAAPPAVAGKKKPKPWKSEEGVIAVPHTMLISSTNETNNITLKEFENRCAFPPATQGLDGFVYEVPKEYQTIQSNILATGPSGRTRQLYIVLYDKDCKRTIHFTSGGGETNLVELDTQGIMPPGTAYVGIADFLGQPGGVIWIELEP